MADNFYVYILASKRNGTLYAGLTSDLVRRVYEHKSKLVAGFTREYGVNKLVFFEPYESIAQARRPSKSSNVGAAHGNLS